MNLPLKNRVAVLTGATGALGRHLAEALVDDGADLVASHLHVQPSLEAALCQRAAARGGRVCWITADLSRPENIERLFEAADALGGCDLLVNSASRFSRAPLAQSEPDALDQLVRLNLTAPMLCAKAAARAMARKRFGDIVNLLDVGGQIPWRHGGAYCATRAGLSMLTRSLALEWAPDIRVNGLAPGLTELSAELGDPAFEQALLNIPMGRAASVADVVAAFRFLLLGPASMTGQILLVDGGRHLIT